MSRKNKLLLFIFFLVSILLSIAMLIIGAIYLDNELKTNNSFNMKWIFGSLTGIGGFIFEFMSINLIFFSTNNKDLLKYFIRKIYSKKEQHYDK